MKSTRTSCKVALSLFLAVFVGCSSAPERPTLAEWVRENTLILSQLASYNTQEQKKGVKRFLDLGKDQGRELGSEIVFYFLNDPAVNNDRVVVLLAWILSVWENPRGIPFLLDKLSSRDEGVLRIAEEGLKAYGDNPRIIERVEEEINNPHLPTRKVIVEILSSMRSPGAVQILGKQLKIERDLDVRGICVLGLAGAKPCRMRIEYLIDALNDPDPSIRVTAWAALSREKNIPGIYDPHADFAGRVQAIANLDRWAKSKPRPSR